MRIAALLTACFVSSANSANNLDPSQTRVTGSAGSVIAVTAFATFEEPWAMSFLPDGRLLVTEKEGRLLLVDIERNHKVAVQGLPEIAYGGQGGLGDVILHPDFVENHWLYLSYAERNKAGDRGAVVVRATLSLTAEIPRLERIKVIWRQQPKVSGGGHYSHRLAFSPDGYLFITSGDRQKLKPAQDWASDLGKVIRLNDDGSVPADNPFQDKGTRAKSFWSLGHRNMLGIAFDAQANLWSHEMGPRHGDELNLIVAGDNYGWPEVSWGRHYSGLPIPNHDTRPEFHAPEVFWVPTIAPSGLIIYKGTLFTGWQGNAIIGGLRSESIIRVSTERGKERELERFLIGKRIREVEQGPEGTIWLLEDKQGGRLLQLMPAHP